MRAIIVQCLLSYYLLYDIYLQQDFFSYILCFYLMLSFHFLV